MASSPERTIGGTPRRLQPPRPPTSKFTRLAMTHALMMGGDAAMVVALADSFFFSVDLDAARTQVMLFLAISFAPFLFVAPLIGPLIDRVAGGRRFMIQAVAVSRIVLLILMARSIDGLALFPLVFASLVLQKTYVVSKSALVPSVVRSDEELVEANAKLGLVAGIVGAVMVAPAAVLLKTIGPSGALGYGVILFGLALASSTRLAKEVVADDAPDSVETTQLHSGRLQITAVAMTVLRANVGFLFFHLAFYLRGLDKGTLLFGAAVGLSALATMSGNAVAPRLRRQIGERTMLSSALAVSCAAAMTLALLSGPIAGVVLACVVNFCAAIGRLGFESIVQSDAPGANRGRAFASFETRFQLAWAVAAFAAVAIQVPGDVGYLIVGWLAVGALVYLRVGVQRVRTEATVFARLRRSVSATRLRAGSADREASAGDDRLATSPDGGGAASNAGSAPVSRGPRG
ncbi:MAG: MFS transporter [Actinomycetota bacterium]